MGIEVNTLQWHLSWLSMTRSVHNPELRTAASICPQECDVRTIRAHNGVVYA